MDSGEKFELLKAIEDAKSSVRSKVEHVFCALFALANLYLARNRMKVA